MVRSSVVSGRETLPFLRPQISGSPERGVPLLTDHRGVTTHLAWTLQLGFLN